MFGQSRGRGGSWHSRGVEIDERPRWRVSDDSSISTVRLQDLKRGLNAISRKTKRTQYVARNRVIWELGTSVAFEELFGNARVHNCLSPRAEVVPFLLRSNELTAECS